MTNAANEIVFVYAAYIAAIVIVTAIIGWTLFENASQRRRLAELEANGVRRRSGATQNG